MKRRALLSWSCGVLVALLLLGFAGYAWKTWPRRVREDFLSLIASERLEAANALLASPARFVKEVGPRGRVSWALQIDADVSIIARSAAEWSHTLTTTSGSSEPLANLETGTGVFGERFQFEFGLGLRRSPLTRVVLDLRYTHGAVELSVPPELLRTRPVSL